MRPSPTAPSPTHRSPTSPSPTSRSRPSTRPETPDASRSADEPEAPEAAEAGAGGAARGGGRGHLGRRAAWLEAALASLGRARTIRRCRCSCSTTRPTPIRPPGSPPRCPPPSCGGSREQRRVRGRRQRGAAHGRGRDVPALLPRRRGARSRRRARHGRGGVPVERRRSSGPKLVDYDHPEILLEVGHVGRPLRRAVLGDRAGRDRPGTARRRPRRLLRLARGDARARRPVPRARRVRRRTRRPGSDDIDLCWRARLAGARVLVAPASRVRHRHGAGDEERRTRRQSPREARAATRARVRVLVKSYSTRRAALGAPERLRAHARRGAGPDADPPLAPRGRGRSRVGYRGAAAWPSCARRARRRRQMRQVDDGDVRDLMIRGSARFRSLLVQRLHAGDRLADASTPGPGADDAGPASSCDARRRSLAAARRACCSCSDRARCVFQRVPEIGGFQAVAGRRVAVVDVHVAVALHDGRAPALRPRPCSR